MMPGMIRERSVQLGYGQARYLEAGEGWPVVLLHAFPLTADMWRPQLDAVPDGWRFIAPDLRGFGPSQSNPAQTMEDLAGGVGELLDALRIESASIGGLSMGGYVMFELLRQDRNRFPRLVLADTRATADTDEGKAGRDKMIDSAHRSGADAVVDEMLPKLVANRSRRPELEAEIRALARCNSPAALAGALGAMRDRPDSTVLLETIAVPTLIVCGEEDVLTPPTEARSMQSRIRRSNLVILPGAGHLSNMEVPEEFSTALADFLAAAL